MKKTLSIFACLLSILAVSCTRENIEKPKDGQEVTVSFSAAIPDVIATKAYSDGKTASKLHYGVYVSGQNVTKFQSTEDFNENLEATVNLTLATGVSYDIIFWAESAAGEDGNETNPYTINWEAKTMTVDYTKINANDENNDAFYAFVKALKVDGAMNEKVDLTRPFAQINLGTNDFDAAKTAGLEVDRTNMVVKLPSVLYFETGNVDTEVDAVFAVKEFDSTQEFPVGGYKYLEMNYVLASSQKETRDFTFNVWEKGMQTSLTPHIFVSNVPLQRNYQTNIYGSLLTDPASITVKIQPVYKEPDHNVPATVEALLNAAENGGDITLESDVQLEDELVVAAGKTLEVDLNGSDILAPAVDTKAAADEDVVAIRVYGELIINGNGKVYGGKGNASNIAIRAEEGSTVTINGGTYSVGADKDGLGNSTIYTTGGDVVINGGHFSTEASYNNWHYVLNQQNPSKGSITVKGGTFVNYNPADGDDAAEDDTYVAEGYESVLREGTDNEYEVKIKAGDAVVTITTAEELRTMLTTLTDSGSGSNTIIIDANIELAEGENWDPVVIQGYTGAGLITIEGKGHHISGLSAPLFLSGFAGDSAINVKDLTIKNSVMTSSSDYAGAFFGQCDAMQGLTFTNCHVENVTISGPDYVAGFVGWTSGWNGAGAVETRITLTDCTVRNCNITSTGDGSIAGFIGHSGANPNNVTTITNSSVSGCTFAQGTLRTDKIGYAIGTVNLAKETTLTKVTGDANYYMKDGVKTVLEVRIGRVTGNKDSKVVVDDTTYTGEQGNIL